MIRKVLLKQEGFQSIVAPALRPSVFTIVPPIVPVMYVQRGNPRELVISLFTRTSYLVRISEMSLHTLVNTGRLRAPGFTSSVNQGTGNNINTETSPSPKHGLESTKVLGTPPQLILQFSINETPKC
jgi:hypothetical protein